MSEQKMVDYEKVPQGEYYDPTLLISQMTPKKKKNNKERKQMPTESTENLVAPPEHVSSTEPAPNAPYFWSMFHRILVRFGGSFRSTEKVVEIKVGGEMVIESPQNSSSVPPKLPPLIDLWALLQILTGTWRFPPTGDPK